jgi:hypothetical protein
MVNKDQNVKHPVPESARRVEPYSGEYYCHCREFQRFTHTPSDHAELRNVMETRRADKLSRRLNKHS